jgi:hypothetical protein
MRRYADTKKLAVSILGDPPSEIENVVAKEACKNLEMGIQMGVQMIHDHLIHKGVNGCGPVDQTSKCANEVLNASNTEDFRRSLLSELTMEVPAVGSHRRRAYSSMAATQRADGQSIRSVMRGHPPHGTWLVEIDDQV